MAGELPFETPLVKLREKIQELEQFGKEKGIDFAEEIARLEERYRQLEEEIYSQITPSQKMHLARHHQRPTSLDMIGLIFEDFIELHGDRVFGDDLAVVGGLAKLNGVPVTVLGQQRGKDTKDNIARFFGSAHPEGFRKALRLMQQADKFRRPIVTFIDTKGAYPGITAEERGQSEAIARNLREMAMLRVPVICVVLGEGGSGGALALGVGNRVLMLENAIYSVISPNGAASILWKDASKADQAAEAMKITAQDLLEMEVIEEIIPEPRGGAHRDYEATASAIKEAVVRHLEELSIMHADELLEDRYRKFRKIGKFTVAGKAKARVYTGSPAGSAVPAEGSSQEKTSPADSGAAGRAGGEAREREAAAGKAAAEVEAAGKETSNEGGTEENASSELVHKQE
ncbi:MULTISPECIES: acetyl-CoA carboxylase carboxyltransferase subunit alpha [Paenibacillus]|uniref:Acetyl-coenzyme A carboxylase carboxyl transferase subunit alpha n=1 Tax=Paenibacillus macerans TaxID=44252 RepID=A0A090YHU4_PAEMA|nr:acetyl-CoA carboxylase, carboxyl transferase, alpha subunit [Paenibacillus macerans]GBK60434.1 acetyl-coenzyme A carboxylase carboxyl transferase subunit alpha [Paenibacillus macerans]GBK66733.1 acetyl-coenzyme A carboxylase carboxyl transferase subunit alpha [Paenibacillus macerans]GIP08989.1 acetyl-coenzyme A carboxylase carboxyl transferase subunit alpha [Paenibacillus macerans]SUA84634.1 acetyl-CoA carboxylase, carboxyl transferase subunit alpha [Paenibacillus macerans]